MFTHQLHFFFFLRGSTRTRAHTSDVSFHDTLIYKKTLFRTGTTFKKSLARFSTAAIRLHCLRTKRLSRLSTHTRARTHVGRIFSQTLAAMLSRVTRRVIRRVSSPSSLFSRFVYIISLAKKCRAYPVRVAGRSRRCVLLLLLFTFRFRFDAIG